MSVLQLRGVSKEHGEGASAVHALRRLDLVVEAGVLVAVMGPSGSGKSTLLTIAGALEEPTTGEVRIDGVAVPGLSANGRARLRRRSIGSVSQDFTLLAGLTAVENVAMPLELDGVAVRKARAEAHGVLDQLGIADKADRFPDDLSGGERQRVAIARALLQRPSVLVLDDALSAVDTETEAQILEALRARQGQHTTIVIAHRLSTLALADKVLVLERGAVVQQGSLEELRSQPGPFARVWSRSQQGTPTEETG